MAVISSCEYKTETIIVNLQCLYDISMYYGLTFIIENANGALGWAQDHTGRRVSESNSQCLLVLSNEVINDGYQYSLLADSR